MIVKFQKRFIVAGFNRKRFPKGVVEDVPVKLRDLLPSSAEILEDYVSLKEASAADDERIAADLARAAGRAEDKANAKAADTLKKTATRRRRKPAAKEE